MSDRALTFRQGMHQVQAPIRRPLALVTGALVVTIFASCMPLPNASATPQVTATPSAALTVAATGPASATATASAQPSITAPLSDRYGIVVETSNGRTFVRSEADPRELGALASMFFYGAASPDGRTVAYWETPPGCCGARVLRLVDGSAPAQPRLLLTLPDSELAATSTGGGIAWSSDGTGLLIAVNSVELAWQGPPVDAPPLYATLRQVDIVTGSVHEVARNEGGLWFGPVAWDRARGISAAVGIGGGGFAVNYVVVRDGEAPVGTQLPAVTLPAGVRAAPDASRVLMRSYFADDDRTVYVWPLTDPARRTTFEPVGDEFVVGAMWRDAREIVVSLSRTTDARDAERLEIWPLEGPRRVVLRGQHRLDVLRPDGTAAITDRGVVDLATGALAAIPGMRGRAGASFLMR